MVLKVGNKDEVYKRSYGWQNVHVCYTGYNSKPFKVDEDNYQIKCLCNAGGITVNKFKEIYINFNLKELGVSEETFLSHFVAQGFVTEFYIYYDRAKRWNNFVYAYYYEKNRKLMPDARGKYNMIFRKLIKFKTQTKAKIDVPNPDYYEGGT